MGTATFLREGLRARLIDGLNPWRRETDETFEVPFHGARYRGRFNDVQDHRVYFLGGYENAELRLLSALSREIDDCVSFDIGCSTGQHMLVLAAASRHVYAFEPFPEVRLTAEQRVAENDIENVTILPFGLAREDASLTYHWDPSNSNRMAGSFVAEHAHLKAYGSLEVRNGDEWARSAGVGSVDLIKIDIEGFEADALIGLRETLTSEPVILMEISWTGFDRLAEAGGLDAVLPFPFHMYKVAPSSTALFFQTTPYRLEPITHLTRPQDLGYNILVVPDNRQRLAAVERWVLKR